MQIRKITSHTNKKIYIQFWLILPERASQSL